MDIYLHDDSFRDEGYGVIAGIDEAGRGPLAGPVVSAAVILDPSRKIPGLRDSKKVPEKERAFLFNEILLSSVDIGLGLADHEEIDRLNILVATRHAMRMAARSLRCVPDAFIVDAVTIPDIPAKQFPIIKADSRSAAVAAASIVAKHVRDMMMLNYDVIYPAYNFRKHKGYGTKDHREAISQFGPCPIHRKSFRQVLPLKLPFSLS